MKLNDFWKHCARNEPDDPGGSPDPATPPAADPEGGGEQAPAPDYSWAPEAYLKDGALDSEAFRARYDELEAEAAARAEAAEGIPGSPDEYEILAPEVDFGELDLPEGFAFELDQGEDIQPIYGEMKEFLHKHSLPKEATSELMGLLAKYEATKLSRGFSSAKADMATLGANAESRISNVSRKLDAVLPKEMADALRAATGTSIGVKAMERLLQPRSVSSPSAQPNGVDVNNLTPRERHALAVEQASR